MWAPDGAVAAGTKSKNATDSRPPIAVEEVSRWTLVALCMMAFLKGTDFQLLPSSFRAMEVELGLEPYELGVLALCQGVSCSFAGPIWGNLVDCGASRVVLLVAGTTIWGCCTCALAFISGFHAMMAVRGLNGVALASLQPVTQSFVADIAKPGERGYIFGWLYFFSQMGQVLACLFVTPLSGRSFFGLTGWRIALMAVGVFSLCTAALPPYLMVEEQRRWRGERFGITMEFKKLWRFLQIPTFGVILLQGIFGTIPGAAMSFSTMYFQYTGMSNAMAAMVNSWRIIGDALGGLLGGMIGDYFASRSALYGRTFAAQISVASSIPCVVYIFLWMPRSEANAMSFAGLLFLQGLLGCWVAPACLCPYMCDIVPKSMLASAYAWELSIVFASGNTLGPVVVSWMAQSLYGYQLSSDRVVDMDPEQRAMNAEALGMSLFYTSVIPYSICALLFSLMYCTYGTDLKAAEAEKNHADDAGPNGSVRESEAAEPHETARLLNAHAGAATQYG